MEIDDSEFIAIDDTIEQQKVEALLMIGRELRIANLIARAQLPNTSQRMLLAQVDTALDLDPMDQFRD